MKIKHIVMVVMLFLAAGAVADAQINLKGLKEKAQNAAKSAVQKTTGNSGNAASSSKSTGSAVSNALGKVASAVPAGKGKTYYVSVSTGSARADGLSASTPMKDLQKAIDAAEDNDIILVAEGNYLGSLDRGYIQVGQFGNGQNDRGKFLSFYGGYSTDSASATSSST